MLSTVSATTGHEARLKNLGKALQHLQSHRHKDERARSQGEHIGIAWNRCTNPGCAEASNALVRAGLITAEDVKIRRMAIEKYFARRGSPYSEGNRS